jgi:hypothetical protein
VKCPPEYQRTVNLGMRACLKFVATPTNYSESATACQQIGGNLIRLDSEEKFYIFKQFLNCEYNCSEVLIITFTFPIAFFFVKQLQVLLITIRLQDVETLAPPP